MAKVGYHRLMLPRIGIVGAGPGGLSLAKLLTQRGYGDIILFERENCVGGKSRTVMVEGLGHELGTCYAALGYITVKQWMEQAGIDSAKTKPIALAEVASCDAQE